MCFGYLQLVIEYYLLFENCCLEFQIRQATIKIKRVYSSWDFIFSMVSGADPSK